MLGQNHMISDGRVMPGGVRKPAVGPRVIDKTE